MPKQPPTFTVFFTGNLQNNVPLDLAQTKFMQKFNIKQEQMQALLEHSIRDPFPIKKSISYEDAKKWATHVEWCGFVCNVKPDSIELDLGISVFDDEDEDDSNVTHWVTCAHCFKRQKASNHTCRECNATLAH